MPSPELFNFALGQISQEQTGDIDRYTVAVVEAMGRNRAELGSDAFDQEVYDFLRHTFDTVEADCGLSEAEKSNIIGRVLALFTYNTYHNEAVAWLAYDDHKTSVSECDQIKV